MWRRRKIEYKTTADLRCMRRAGLVVADALDAVQQAIAPGVSTAELDAVAAAVIARAGATSNFLGYHGFPATTCISVNDEVVHGIPGPRRVGAGDVVSVDCGAVVDGWHADSAITVVAPPADDADARLSDLTQQALWAGIAALRVGGRIADVGAAVEEAVAGRAGIIQEYTGHGIGTSMHQPPDVPNFRQRPQGPRILAGLCVAIEPMLTGGDTATTELDDGWTVITSDGSRAAHWEHSVAVLTDGLFVLTAHDGGAARLRDMGMPVARLEE